MASTDPTSVSSPDDGDKGPSEWEEYYVGRIEHEHSLVNNRLTWLLFSQTIFFGIYANLLSRERPTVQQDRLIGYIPWFAIVTCILVSISIGGAIDAMRHFQAESAKKKIVQIAGPRRSYVAGLVAPIGVPLLIIVAWGLVVITI